MNYGRTIRIFLEDGTVTGIRHAEIVNWTGQAIVCPRSKISLLNSYAEAKRPGVYFLFGFDEDSDQKTVYIGEAENVLVRVIQHLKGKDFWSDLIFFTSKDENLTKGHVKYLEHRLCELANGANRYKVENGNIPQKPSLPKSDLHAMDEFIENVRILLGTLGHLVIEPMPALLRPQDSEPRQSTAAEKFYIRAKDTDASGIPTDDGFLVFQQSVATSNPTASMPEHSIRLRERLISEGILKTKNGKLIFTKDYLFKTPSAAATIILGNPRNGLYEWKNSKGMSLRDLEVSLPSSP